MDIQIYTTPGCIYCENIKKLMRRANVEYTAHIVGVDISKEEFRNRYPLVAGFPYAVIDGKEIGGIIETAKLFIEKGLVSTKKNE